MQLPGNYAHGGDVYAPSPTGSWLDFSANINPLGLAPAVKQAVLEHLDGVVHYPDPHMRDLKKALAQHYEVPEDHSDLSKFMTQTLRTLKQRKMEELMQKADAEAVMRAVRMQKELGRLEIRID